MQQPVTQPVPVGHNFGSTPPGPHATQPEEQTGGGGWYPLSVLASVPASVPPSAPPW
jgi:hypothetical protein